MSNRPLKTGVAPSSHSSHSPSWMLTPSTQMSCWTPDVSYFPPDLCTSPSSTCSHNSYLFLQISFEELLLQESFLDHILIGVGCSPCFSPTALCVSLPLHLSNNQWKYLVYSLDLPTVITNLGGAKTNSLIITSQVLALETHLTPYLT